VFDHDKWQEIWATIKKNRLRTALTMFGVFWGIFMLMVLLGSGNGLETGVRIGFESWATNAGFMWGNKTTMAYEGFKPGRYLRFYNEDIIALRENVKGLDKLAPRNSLGSWRGGNNVFRGNKSGPFNVYGDYPDFQHIQIVNMVRGRHLNDYDLKEKRKVAVLGQEVVNVLFESDEEPIGEYIKINGIFFQVIGVFKSLRTDEMATRDMQTVYIPFSTFQQAFNYGNRVGWFSFTAKEGIPVSIVEQNMKDVLKKRHHVNPEDHSAIGSNNLEEEFGRINGLFFGISLFNWIVGIGTLFAGVIGVSNIMLIIVKERTKEIGIRKSIGATPLSIISLILQESIVLTAFAGYIGLVLGTFLLEGINYAMEKFDLNSDMFAHPGVDLRIALTAFGILIICGAFAGLIPARKAASISPIEAIRIE
jgi:putative ABC transport system permease protein